MTQRKKLIEGGLPLPEINDASAYDKLHGIGPHLKGTMEALRDWRTVFVGRMT